MKKTLKRTLKGLRVVISSHVSATGPALDLEEFLRDKVKNLLFIGHPFASVQGRPSFYRVYKAGSLQKEGEGVNFASSGILVYLREVFYNLLWSLKQGGVIDLYIGSDGFLTYIGVLLKRLGKAKKVVYYTIDYVPNRFSNRILNELYRFVDSQSAKGADMVWNLSEKIVEARKRFYGLESRDLAPQIVVPVGIWLERVKKNRNLTKDKNRIIFLGHLIKKQGLQVVIDALAKISKNFPRAHLYVIGTGPYEKILKLRAKRKGIIDKVFFLGFIADHQEVEKELAKSSISVATYAPTPDSFTYFTDPGKIKSYLAAGLPIILTNVPQIAGDLVKNRCALITDYDAVSVARDLADLLGDDSKLKFYSANALRYAEKFDWNRIFWRALEKTL
ncbi:MAG: glycosyltransferase [Patescibacteria group bacterium]